MNHPAVDWYKLDDEGRINLCKEFVNYWINLTQEKILEYGSEENRKLSRELRDYFSHLLHDGNRECGNVRYYIDREDKINQVWIPLYKLYRITQHLKIFKFCLENLSSQFNDTFKGEI